MKEIFSPGNSCRILAAIIVARKIKLLQNNFLHLAAAAALFISGMRKAVFVPID